MKKLKCFLEARNKRHPKTQINLGCLGLYRQYATYTVQFPKPKHKYGTYPIQQISLSGIPHKYAHLKPDEPPCFF